MLEFLGRLMGISLRTNACLPFMFPPLVWKALLGEPAMLDDLAPVDGAFHSLLVRLRDSDAATDDELEAAFGPLAWEIGAPGGGVTPLLDGGSELRVTVANRGRFVAAAAEARLRDLTAPVAALRRGFANLVPLRALALYTWQELDVLVCGRAEVSVEVLRRNTLYEGYTAAAPVVDRFWRVFGTFTDAERALYLRCVGWLGGGGEGAWETVMIANTNHYPVPYDCVQVCVGPGAAAAGGRVVDDAAQDHAAVWRRPRAPHVAHLLLVRVHCDVIVLRTMLPSAHPFPRFPIPARVCSTIDLPEYTTDERMAWGLRTAMTFSVGGILNG